MDANILDFVSKKLGKKTPNLIIPNIINYLESNDFTYAELEEWINAFVPKYNDMVERRNKVEYKAKLENKKVELLQIIEYQKDILNELEKQIEKYS
jgi:hypothetical protein